jgi:phosphoglucosamine mutase
MQQNGCRIGGEQSGHIIFSKYASTGDGILTSLKMMEVMMAKKQKMSQLCEGLNIYPQVLQNVRVADKAEALANPDVQAAIEQVTAELGDTGRILVRESGTEPVIRVMVKALIIFSLMHRVDWNLSLKMDMSGCIVAQSLLSGER